MKIVRLLFLTGLALVVLAWFSHSNSRNKLIAPDTPKKENTRPATSNSSKKLEQKAEAAKLFVHRKGFNENTCLFIDMSLPSGQNRFFIYDLFKDTLQSSGLVAHGNCFEYWLEGRRYSNAMGSGCTSLGKYKIGNSYTGKFGYSYKLIGLDSSNSNAFERTVVLHAHSCIPETEVDTEICQSNGCPTVSPNLLSVLKKIINTSTKPVLLWIYE
ncbi:MAG: murein L,D-transpeptidase catalytic domain family protein [Chitinophagaceae bacterium]|nr:murein L,D-transpeptidase catalytic domain family protein [Chitinophagaceae bacterium]